MNIEDIVFHKYLSIYRAIEKMAKKGEKRLRGLFTFHCFIYLFLEFFVNARVG